MKQIRQGDILLVEVSELPPKDADIKKRVILAEGEITGHAHKLTAEKGIVSWGDFVLVQGDEPGELHHEDHDPTPAAVIPAGITFKVIHQKEFTLDEQWVQVLD